MVTTSLSLPFPDASGVITSTAYYGDTLYVVGADNDNKSFVYSYKDNSWARIGDYFNDVILAAITIDGSGTIFVGGYDGNVSPRAYFFNKKLWVDMNIASLISEGAVGYLYHDAFGNIYALYFLSNREATILKYNGTWVDTRLNDIIIQQTSGATLNIQGLAIRSSGNVLCGLSDGDAYLVDVFDGSWNLLSRINGGVGPITVNSVDSIIIALNDTSNINTKFYIVDTSGSIEHVDISNTNFSVIIPGPDTSVFCGGYDSSNNAVVYTLENNTLTQLAITGLTDTIQRMTYDDTNDVLYIINGLGQIFSFTESSTPSITDRPSFIKYIETLTSSTQVTVVPSDVGLEVASGDDTVPLQLLLVPLINGTATAENPQAGECLYIKCNVGDTFLLKIEGDFPAEATVATFADKSITVNGGARVPFGNPFDIVANDGYTINLTNYINGSIGVLVLGYTITNGPGPDPGPDPEKPENLSSSEIGFIASSGASFAAAVVGAIVVGVGSNKQKYSKKSIDISTGIGSSLIGAGVAASALLLAKGLLDRKKRINK